MCCYVGHLWDTVRRSAKGRQNNSQLKEGSPTCFLDYSSPYHTRWKILFLLAKRIERAAFSIRNQLWANQRVYERCLCWVHDAWCNLFIYLFSFWLGTVYFINGTYKVGILKPFPFFRDRNCVEVGRFSVCWEMNCYKHSQVAGGPLCLSCAVTSTWCILKEQIKYKTGIAPSWMVQGLRSHPVEQRL